MTKIRLRTRVWGIFAALFGVALVVSLAGCGASSASSTSGQASSASLATSSSASSSATSSSLSSGSSSATTDAVTSKLSAAPTKESLTTSKEITNSVDGEHAIQANGETATYRNVAVTKTGNSDSGDEADFYGDNAAVFATDDATLNLADMVIETNGTHANGVFSYGEGTTVNIVDSVIETSGNCSGGLMTTGGATMNATNLRINTSGNSSAAIRSDRGGGTVNVDGGVYTTSGTGSPAIYSTADITVSNAELESTASQGVVVEGKNSVTLKDVKLAADNNTKNSNKSDFYQAVMIYQSMSGDAANGEASFTMDGGSLTNANGDIFFVNNTVATINLAHADIVNNDANGVFLRAAAAGWGNEGSNGGQVFMNASHQAINGDVVVDDVSLLNLYLKDESIFNGSINASGAAGNVYVELSGGSTWTLTADSYITSLTCDAGAVNLNGHMLYVNGEAYDGASASSGQAIEIVVSDSKGGPDEGAAPPDGGKPGNAGGEGPHGNGGSHDGNGPDGARNGSTDGGTPPEKPSNDANGVTSDKPSGKDAASSSTTAV